MQFKEILQKEKFFHSKSEELKDPRLSQTLAAEIPNGKVLLLSPIEAMNQEEQNKDIGYIDKMKMNLQSLKQGLKCF